MKVFRANATPGPGNQPVRFLHPLILGAFENVRPDFLTLLQEQVNFREANPEIVYNINHASVKCPYITGSEGTIHLQESFLSYLWAICYTSLVFYDEIVVRPKTTGYSRSEEQQSLITDAINLFNYAQSLIKEYTPWLEDQLPNPALYSKVEALYIEKADAIFVQAAVLIMLHEFAHFYLGHLDDEVSSEHFSTEIKFEESAADRFAIENMMDGAVHSDEETRNTIYCGMVVGFGAILLLYPTLDGGEEHPNPLQRLEICLNKINIEADSNLWGLATMMLNVWSISQIEQPIGGYQADYNSLKELFKLAKDQLEDFTS